MLIEPAGRLVERHGGQRAAVDRLEEILAVLQVQVALRGARCEAGVEIEGMVMWLEVRAALVTIVDDLAFLLGRPPSVGQRRVPASRIPGPADVPGRHPQ